MRWKKLLKYLGLGCSVTLLTVLLGLAVFPATARLNATEVSVSNTPTTQLLNSNPLQLVQQGKARYQSGDFTQAVTLWEQAAAVFASQGDNLNQAMALSNLALAYQQLGNWTQANHAIATALELLQPEHPGNPTERLKILAQALNTQGSLQLAQGQTEQAITSWQQAANTYQQIGDEQGRIQSTINQAQALKTTGLYPRACQMLLPPELKDQGCRAVTQSILLKTLEQQPDTLTQAARLLNLGDTLRLVGKPEESRVVLRLSLAMAQRLQSPPDESAAWLSLGNTQQVLARKACEESSDSESSEPEIQEALNSYQNAFNYYQQAATTATSPTAQIQAQLNQLSLLVNIQKSANTYNTEICKNQVQQWARRQNLGLPQIQNQLDRLPLSRTAIYARINLAQNLMALRQQENTPPDSPLPTPSEIDQILAKAVQQAKELRDFQAQSYALGYLGQLYEQTKQWTQAKDLTEQALHLAQASQAPDNIAYRWEWQLGRIYKAQATTDRALAYYKAAFKSLQTLRRDLAVSDPDLRFSFRDQTEQPVYLELVDLLLRSQHPSQENLQRAREVIESSQENLQQAREVIESLQILDLENFLREPCAKANPKSLDRVVENQAPTAAVIYPIILPDRLEVILKLPHQDLQNYSSNVKQGEIEALLYQLRQNLETEYRFVEVEERSHQLYQWIIAPIEKRLEAENIDTLVFVLHGSLQTIPMAALYDGKNYLIEKYAVAVSLGLTMPEPKPLPKERLKVLAAGLSTPPEAFRSMFSKLTHVEDELNNIQQPGVSTTFLRDRSFTAQAFNKLFNESTFQIIHLATHGQFSSNPEKTFILDANGKINLDELGHLFRARTLNRPDVIELLILSACETASGDKRAPLGIAGTVVRAGAGSAIATLWTVYDEVSVDFTKEFYTQLLKPQVTKAQALRQAQLKLRKQYQHPRNWAPYILTGNWM